MRWIAILSVIYFISCKPTKEKLSALPILNGTGNHAIVSCEGIFPRGNAGISVIDQGTAQVWEDVFFQANNRRIGDVLQSITLRNGKAYCVVNNSSKIEVIDLNTWNTVQSVQKLGTPRYLHFTGNGQAWLTDIFSRQILILDEHTLAIIKRIPFPHWSEQMVQFGDSLYFNSPDVPYLFRASVSRQQIEDSMLLPGPSGALLKTGSTFWAAFENAANGNPGLLHFSGNRLLHTVTTNYSAGLSTRMASNVDEDTLYFLSQHLYRISATNPPLQAEPVKLGTEKNYYALGLDQKTKRIWLGDAIDFQQRGQIEVYENASLLPKNTFKVGLIPGHIYFY